MTKITKKEAIRRFKSGEKIHSYRRIDGLLSVTWDPKTPHSTVQSLLDRDGRRFDFCIGVT